MSAAVDDLFARGNVRNGVMVEIDYPSGMGRFFSGLGVIEYGGNNYYGFGILGSVSEVVSSTEIEIVEVSFNLSGVDPDIIASLETSIKGRSGLLYEVFFDSHYRAIERDLLLEAVLDYQLVSIGEGGKANVALKAHAGLFFLRSRSAAKISPEEARAVHPDETGFDLVHLQEDISPVWKAS